MPCGAASKRPRITLFAARNAASAKKDAELQANAIAKETLLAEAEKLDTANHEAARTALHSIIIIIKKWNAIDRVLPVTVR